MDTEPKNSLVKVNRRDLSEPVIKKLFALSGNQCAMPNCGVKLAYQDIHKVKAIICHIEGAAKGGPLHNPQQTEEERNDYPNLIVLCPNCHAEIDANPQKYSIECVQTVKQTHEAKFKNNSYKLPTDISEILRVSVNQDEFSVNDILRLFAIYLELEDTEAKEYFFVNRLKYSLNNLSLKTLESDSTTQSELDDIFVNVSKLSDNEFVDSFMTLQNKIPSQLFKNYVNRNKDRLKKILVKGDKLIPFYWLMHEQNEGSLMALVDNAGEYGAETFKGLIDEFDFTQFGSEKKLSIEGDLWKKLDKAKDSVICQNLLYLDNRLFNSLQANEILH